MQIQQHIQTALHKNRSLQCFEDNQGLPGLESTTARRTKHYVHNPPRSHLIYVSISFQVIATLASCPTVGLCLQADFGRFTVAITFYLYPILPWRCGCHISQDDHISPCGMVALFSMTIVTAKMIYHTSPPGAEKMSPCQ